MDRYVVGDRYRQVMVSARELSQQNLPRQSQTFVNTRFKYTHGYGLTLATVSDFTPEGLPNLLVKEVIRGNVLAIPLDHTLLYVEPIYLEAETAAYPELRLVAVMHGDDLSYAETFDEALKGLFGPEQPAAAGAGAGALSLRQLGTDANAAFERYLSAQGEGRFQDAAAAITELQSLLSRLAAEAQRDSGAAPISAQRRSGDAQ
jgi:uncharacterized membrane protein (UPF0182 family)